MALTKIDDRGLKTPIDLLDNEKIRLGTGNDLEIYHSTDNNSYIHESGSGSLVLKADDVYIQNAAGSHTNILADSDGRVELSFNGSKKLETTNAGVKITGSLGLQMNGCDVYIDDGKTVTFGGSNDLQIYHSTDSFIKNDTNTLRILADSFQVDNNANSEVLINAVANGATELYWDGSKKLETGPAGIIVAGYVSAQGDNGYAYICNDNLKSSWGSGLDLNIYHNGTNSYIDNNTNNIYIRANVDNDDGGNIYIEAKSGETSIECADDSFVSLYYDGSKKLQTTAAGITVTGTVTDSTGYSLRKIPKDAKTGSYTLQATDGGKFIPNSTGGWTIPNSTMNIGDVVTLINDSGSDQTIVQGTNHTIYNTADGTTGNRTLAARGMATLIWLNNSVCYISGAGLS